MEFCYLNGSQNLAPITRRWNLGRDGAKRDSPIIQDLGDFSVNYRISGLMEDIGKLISTRRMLRANTLDALHDADIEIVSPTYMSTRSLNSSDKVLPRGIVPVAPDASHPNPDEVVFDKAQQADALDELKREYTDMSQQLIQVEQELKEAGPGDERRPITLKKKSLEAKLARHEKEIAKVEAEMANGDG